MYTNVLRERALKYYKTDNLVVGGRLLVHNIQYDVSNVELVDGVLDNSHVRRDDENRLFATMQSRKSRRPFSISH